MIQALLFDLWGTLIVHDPAVSARRDALRARMVGEALVGLGFSYETSDITAAFMAAGAQHGALHDNEIDLSARGRTVVYLRHLDEALGDRLDDAGWRLLDEAVLTPALSHRPSMMPGVGEMLAAVKAEGLPMGLISNAGITPGFVLRQILDGHGLLEYLDVTVFSDEVELAKPALAIFEGALAEMGVAAAAAAFVGDQAVLDVFGARRAGMWSVQIGDHSADGIEPHARIASLDELVPALRELRLLA